MSAWNARLAGPSKGAKGREQLLQEARLDREARQNAKALTEAAIHLQAAWRGYAARSKLMKQARTRVPVVPVMSEMKHIERCKHLLVRWVGTPVSGCKLV
jgi:IQ calmodulin-binding motif